MDKILIFGANGFVGKYLIEELIDSFEIVATDITKCDYKNISYFQMDLCCFESVKALINSVKPNYIINLAAISSVGYSWNHPQDTINVNVIGALNILESVISTEIELKRILLVGSSEEYNISNAPLTETSRLNMNNPYGISKIAQEKFAEFYNKRYNLDIICTRTFNHTGVGQNINFAIPSFVNQIVKCCKNNINEIHVGNLDVIRDIGDVRDMVRAYKMLLLTESNEKVFNVGSGKGYKLRDIVEYLIKLSHKDIKIVIDDSKLRPNEVMSIICDNSLIKSEIGWEPQYNVFDAIKLMFERNMSEE